MPREFAELPYARYVEPLTARLEPEGDYECVRIDDERIDDVDARHSRFAESAWANLTITDGSLEHTRFGDVWLHRVDFTRTALNGTDWLDAEVIESAWAGVEIIGAGLRRVEFSGCKLDSVNFRSTRLRDVTFRDCVLRDADFSESTLTSVSFPDTRVERITLSKAALTRVDFRGAATLSIAEGIDALRGAIIDRTQLLELAPHFAATLGLTVTD